MPSVELLNRHAHPDGWHNVRSPGGYEWWYFDAEDAATDTQVVAIFMEGFIFHAGYLRRYDRYRRHPTRHLPPVAGDFPCVYLCVYREGRVWKQSFTQFQPEAFQAATSCCDVRIGADNAVRTLRDDGTFELRLHGVPWELTARGPVHRRDQSLTAQLRFSPSREAAEDQTAPRRFLSRAMTGADHFWSVIAPRCNVQGTIGWTDTSFTFSGTGYHDHNYGTAPIGDGLARWTWGRAMFGGDRVVTFHHAEPTDRLLPVETHLIEATPQGTRELPTERVAADWSLVSNPAMRLRYPRSIDFGPALRLSEPRVVDPSPFYLRLTFTAESFGERSTAFCEIAYPHRLRWPLLGRMIEMSFDKRPLGRK